MAQQHRYPPQQYQQQQQQQPVVLPALSQAFDHRASTASDASYLMDSRRSSVDQRMNNNMGSLALNPYEANNVSTTSLASNLQQQRGITRGNGMLSPSARRTSGASSTPSGPRRAPAIQPLTRSQNMPNPMSSTPTKGFAWAFPDQDDQEGSSPDSSRQGSITTINTIDSNAYSVRQNRYEGERKDI